MRQLKITQTITKRDTASLDKYLADISKLSVISAEEETVLAQRIKAGDQSALEELTTANLRFVVSVAKQYQNRGITLSDLISEGNIGLVKAAMKFDETRGFKFISYAVWWIRQSIMQAISDQSRVIRLPLNKISILGKIRRAQDVLEQKLERPASVAELAENLDLSEEDVELTLRSSHWHVSTDATIGGSEDATLLDVKSDPDARQPDQQLMHNSLMIEVRRSMSTLTERERNVIGLFYGLSGEAPKSLTEIAEAFDLTRERVRQIKEKALRRLKYSARSKNLRTFLG